MPEPVVIKLNPNMTGEQKRELGPRIADALMAMARHDGEEAKA